MKNIKYCALTTISLSMKQFVLPSMIYLAHHGYEVTISCAEDNEFAKSIPDELSYFPLDIDRGYNLKKTVKSIFRLYKFFKKEKIDMVEYGTENVSFCASIAAWMARVPVRIYNHWGARYIGYTGFSRSVSLLIERTAALFSTTVRQQSQKNMQMCIDDHVYPAKKVSVIGYGGTIGADFTRFDIKKKQEYKSAVRKQYGIPETDIVFGDVGSIRRDKGSNELLEAFLNIDCENVWLILIGGIFEADSPDKVLLEKAKKNKHIIFTGHITDVEKYISAFDCIVHPSYREGLGMVLQEAGAMGIPYITSDIPGPSEFGINGKTGLLVEKGNADDLRQKMERLVNQPKLLCDMSAAVYELTKERYERTIMIQRIFEDRELLRKELRNGI